MLCIIHSSEIIQDREEATLKKKITKGILLEAANRNAKYRCENYFYFLVEGAPCIQLPA